MSRMPSPRRPGFVAAALALVVLTSAAVGACGRVTSPAITFDPAAPCTADGQMPGAYPELEALLPAAYEGLKPDAVDSGRTCTPDGLGSLEEAGIAEVRFAGATWNLGGGRGVTVAVFRAAGLDAAEMLAFYEAGARTARRTEKLSSSDVTVAGRPGKRLDVLQSDGTGQTVVTWPAQAPDVVHVLLAADIGDERVAEAIEAFGDR